MSGFFGVVHRGENVAPADIGRAAETIMYRGNNAPRYYGNHSCQLIHCQFSILDETTELQPMTDESGRYVCVYDGDLYNYTELRDQLTARGNRFFSETDTEVMLRGIIDQGADFLKQTNGMFSVAIWDNAENVLILARDPLGKKPLYVWESESGHVMFSSSLAAFRVFPDWRGVVNKGAIVQFVRTGIIPPPLTIYRGTRAILPGTLETYRLSHREWTITAYDAFVCGKTRRKITDEEMLSEIDRALSIRLPRGVPTGLTFSAGVDSGILACRLAKSNYPVSLYNIDYDSATDRSPERQNAREVAAILGLPLILEDFAPLNLFGALPEAYCHYDQPCSQLSLVFFYQLSRAMCNHGVKVAICGNGGDELFFGYTGDRNIRILSDKIRYLLPIIPSRFLSHPMRLLKGGDWRKYALETEEQSTIMITEQVGFPMEEVMSDCAPYMDAVDQQVRSAEFRRYTDYVMWNRLYLHCAGGNVIIPDVSGMHGWVEYRSPYLDWRLVKVASMLPESMRVGSYFNDKYNKAVLKRLYARMLGPQYAYDAKRGMAWNIRFDKWIRDVPEINQFVRNTIRILDSFGVQSAFFLSRFDDYCSDNALYKRGASEVVAGMMLALWLKKEFSGLEALHEWVEPMRKIKWPGGQGDQANMIKPAAG